MKETDTAAKLRKHVAIHIKNEGLNLTIAEAASGRGRLEVPSYTSSHDSSGSPSHGSITPLEDEHPQLTYSTHAPSYSSYNSASLTPSSSPYTTIAQRPLATLSLSYDTCTPIDHPPVLLLYSLAQEVLRLYQITDP
ncbi:hypothetical protein DID88_005123 [Monilinia fructigena]|uniref:Uncharacterized protein n=1 Tax=Monilinia fructigena TaxID=38457 RepID=A0A395IGA1_9HELO|nr:hypothetical protein DID88_005123 [Monilinia fructigena]